jgi:chromosome segregation ATPase
MNQRIVEDLSRAIYRAMPKQATGDQKAAVDAAARAVFAKHFDACNAEANELDQIIARKDTELAAARAELAPAKAEITDLRDTIRQLRAEIIAADSAFNAGGHTSAWEETTGLVRLCHEGRAALDAWEQVRTAPDPVRTLGLNWWTQFEQAIMAAEPTP